MHPTDVLTKDNISTKDIRPQTLRTILRRQVSADNKQVLSFFFSFPRSADTAVGQLTRISIALFRPARRTGRFGYPFAASHLQVVPILHAERRIFSCSVAMQIGTTKPVCNFRLRWVANHLQPRRTAIWRPP